MAFDTTDIERKLLKLLVTNSTIARMFLPQLHNKLFSKSRLYIINIVKEIHKKTPTIITKELFEAELSKRFPEEKDKKYKERFLTEWNLIEGSIVLESPDALFDKLKEHETLLQISDICSKTLELLQKGDITEATNLIKRESIDLDNNLVTEKTIIELVDYEDLEKQIQDQKNYPEKYGGIRTGFPYFDNITGGLFKSELTLISAITGIGKSTALKQIAYNVIMGNQSNPDPTKRYIGKNVLHVTNEEHRDQVRMKYFSLFTKIDYAKFKRATLSDFETILWQKTMTKLKEPQYGKIFIKEVPQFSNISEIYREYYNLQQQGIKIDVIILDYLDHLGPLQKAWSENDEQAKVAWDCKGLCIDLNIPFITATQAATIVDQKQEKGRRFGRLDVYGSKRRIHASNTFMGIMLAGFDDKQLRSNGGDRDTEAMCDKFWTAEVAKSRDGATFKFELRHKVLTGEVIEENWSRGGRVTASECEKISVFFDEIETGEESSEKTEESKIG